MRSWPEYSNFFLSLLVIINPILPVPLFLSYTRGYSTAERRRAARLTSTTVLAALVAAALTGEALLRIFGTSLGAFRVGGGIVLFLMALVMLRVHADKSGSSFQGCVRADWSPAKYKGKCPANRRGPHLRG